MATSPYQSSLVGHQLGHVLFPFFLLKAFVDTLTVGNGSVLAHLPLSLDTEDRYFHSDNCLNLILNERRRRIAHFPRFRTVTFLGRSQSANLLSQPIGIINDTGHSPDLHDDIIPRWNNPPMLFL